MNDVRFISLLRAKDQHRWSIFSPGKEHSLTRIFIVSPFTPRHRHVNFNDVDKGGNAPLHVAAMSGRAANVEVLLRKAKENVQPENVDDEENDEQPVNEKYGPASIHRLNKAFYSPLHLAVLNNHLVRHSLR